MNISQIRRLDLNLLLVFSATLRHRQLATVARELGLTTSAISHALDRLRALFDDELFVRISSGVMPTPRALALEPKIAKIIDAATSALEREDEFDPGRDHRSLSLGINEHVEPIIVSPLCAVIAREAPNIRLTVRALLRRDMVAQIYSRNLDVGLGFFYGDVGNLVKETLYDEDVTVVARKRHPKIRGRLTRKAYLDCEHIVVTNNPNSDSMSERYYHAYGVYRNITLVLPRYHSAFRSTSESDRLFTVPTRLAANAAKSYPLDLYKLPFPQKPFNIGLIMHPNAVADPAIAWLCGKIRAIAGVFAKPASKRK